MKYHTIAAIFPEITKYIVDGLANYGIDEAKAYDVLNKFILLSVAADGILSIEEFMLIRPFFEKKAGQPVEYDDAMWMFMDMKLNEVSTFKNALDAMHEVYSKISDDLRKEIIKLCLYVCVADGTLSEDEKTWIRQLYDPAPDFDADKVINEILTHRHNARKY